MAVERKGEFHIGTACRFHNHRERTNSDMRSYYQTCEGIFRGLVWFWKDAWPMVYVGSGSQGATEYGERREKARERGEREGERVRGEGGKRDNELRSG